MTTIVTVATTTQKNIDDLLKAYRFNVEAEQKRHAETLKALDDDLRQKIGVAIGSAFGLPVGGASFNSNAMIDHGFIERPSESPLISIESPVIPPDVDLGKARIKPVTKPIGITPPKGE